MMDKLGRALGTAFAAVAIAQVLWAEPAAAQSFPAGGTNVVASALALPIDLRSNGRVTEIVITNAGPARFLHVTLIDDDWSAQDFNCFVTANETTLFEFRRDSFTDQPTLSFECTSAITTPPVPSNRFTNIPVDIDQGIMFVTVENPEGTTVVANQIFGDATVIDFDQGLAYSFDAIPFLSAMNDGNRQYVFNGVEYSAFPARLATNFIAPTRTAPWGSDDIIAELVLFTLDGTIGSGNGPEALLSVVFFNDDEVRYSATHRFDAFDIVRLDAIDPRFFADALGSDAGHLVLTPEFVNYSDFAHDFLFGPPPGGQGFNGIRRTPVHGWLVESAISGTQIGEGTLWLADDVAWGRPLARSLTNLVPDPGDLPTLNALCDVPPCP
jgi:hypothetical protein